MKKLSIILPIYNVEKYIQSCLISIFKQEAFLDSFEVIIVNDGTQDDSMYFVNEFKQRYDNIEIISQINQGLSSARNNGFNLATGEYVWFVDSDDELLDDSINNIYNIIDLYNPDVIASQLLEFHESNQTKKNEIYPDKRGLILGKDYLFNYTTGAIQRFIFKRKFLMINNLQFKINVLHEDAEYGSRVLYLADSVYVSEYLLYLYRIRITGSIMSSWKIKSAYDLIDISKSLIKFRNDNVIPIDYSKYNIIIFRTIQYVFILSKAHYADTEFTKFYYEKIGYIRKMTFELLLKNPINLKEYCRGLLFYLSPKLFCKFFLK